MQAQQQMTDQKQQAEKQLQLQQEQEKTQPKPKDGEQGGDDLGADKAMAAFTKSEEDLISSKDKLRKQHSAIVDKILTDWVKDSEVELDKLADLVVKNKKN